MNNLRKLRESKGIKTQKQLAGILGVSHQSVQKWESGERTPRPAMMQKIQDLFGVPKEEIFFTAFSYVM
ncbi:helix-turn-helix transcriptional regulator [Lacticaseibacillus saniviri]|uniref:helix-turn-helix transcriptional regulator n=1 Tax=Lacticaseibacillus saniviri TaxID=931533 RepID=UPI0007052D56|nr:helix-turn-helix transcriptional regulator [Lacticaseibacillus saniviri]